MASTTSTRIRNCLLASTALLALPGVAQAQSRPADVLDEAHDAVTQPVSAVETPHTGTPVVSAVNTAFIDPSDVVDTPQIAINNNFTPSQVFDANNITGVGQVVTDSGGGSVGLCTGTLINPRTIIFAAHCVNTRAATAYGAGSGGVGIAVGFETNTRANAAGQPDELVNWLTGGGAGPGRFQTNRAQSLYNIDQVFYNPASLSAASCTAPGSCFLEADVATAVLDAPTRNVPTWTMLFSPLNTPAAINPATGTGYHVTITGYGRNGNGTTGAVNTDFRRRVAENMLGALTSINERNLFLFGTAGSPSRPQLLYWLDFDDPARGTATADPDDFNGFRDNALPREGSTGPGDSGGPLILDTTFSSRTILGVLSGGSTFFAGQPGGSYGTQSFYQPLFLYWDWIVANNPYRYVTAVTGNRNWEDTAAWVTELDPAYQILSNGNLVNGLPTNLGGTNVVTNPQFGELCFQSPSSSNNPAANDCENLATGATRSGVPNTPTGTGDTNGVQTEQIVANTAGAATGGVTTTAQLDPALAGGRFGLGGASDSAIRDELDGAIETPQADPGYVDVVRPAPTLANGLPGATGFTPNNVAGVRATGAIGRYYDVTLRNAGTITLNSAVTIDRFSIAGAQSQLTVAAGASLTSLIDTNQLTGIVNVNGTINSGGDYFFMSGLLTGTGRVNAPFLTSLLGNFAPGTLGTIGTLTVGGNLIMSSGTTYAVDIGNGGTSDRIAVVAAAGQTGSANVGGRVIFSPVAGSTVRNQDLFTILTAQGGVTGTFTTAPISAILTPTFIYTQNSVLARLVAGQFQSVVANTPIQRTFAALLDINRPTNTANLSALYDFLDLQNAATIQSTLEGLAPRTETLVRTIGTAGVENMDRMWRGRVETLDLGGDYDGSLAIVGSPLQVLASSSAAGVMTAGAASATTSLQPDAQVQPGRLPQGVRGFVAGGYIDGEGRSMPTAIPFGGKDKFDGWYIAAGIETMVGDNAAIGFGLSYSDLNGTTGGVAQQVTGKLYQGTLYGKAAFGDVLTLDGRLSAGLFELNTRRAAVVGPTTFDLRSEDNSLAVSSEVGVAALFGDTLKFGPRVAFRASNVGFSKTVETGGAAGLRLVREDASSAQALAGLTVAGSGMRFKPYASAYYVHDFLRHPTAFGANFAAGSGGGNLLFDLAAQDRNWGEVAVGLTFGGERFSISVGADTTVFRKDVENQAYRGSVSFKF